MSFTNRTYSKGLTLIELMVTLAVVLVLLAISVPAFDGLMRSSTLGSISSDFVSDLGIARAEAPRRTSAMTMCPSINGTTCGGDWINGWIVGVDANRDGAVDAGGVVRTRSAIPLDGYTITASAGPAFIMVTPTGNVTPVRTYTICKPGAEGRTIAISLAGRPTVNTLMCP